MLNSSIETITSNYLLCSIPSFKCTIQFSFISYNNNRSLSWFTSKSHLGPSTHLRCRNKTGFLCPFLKYPPIFSGRHNFCPFECKSYMHHAKQLCCRISAKHFFSPSQKLNTHTHTQFIHRISKRSKQFDWIYEWTSTKRLYNTEIDY